MSWFRQQGPNPESPESVFVDGDFLFQVNVVPALFPMVFTQDSGGLDLSATLFADLYKFTVNAAVQPFDRRYKVAVSRRGNARRQRWRIIGLDFYPDFDSAVARQAEILTRWDLTAVSTAAPLTREQMRRARLAKAS